MYPLLAIDLIPACEVHPADESVISKLYRNIATVRFGNPSNVWDYLQSLKCELRMLLSMMGCWSPPQNTVDKSQTCASCCFKWIVKKIGRYQSSIRELVGEGLPCQRGLCLSAYGWIQTSIDEAYGVGSIGIKPQSSHFLAIPLHMTNYGFSTCPG